MLNPIICEKLENISLIYRLLKLIKHESVKHATDELAMKCHEQNH